MPTSIAIAVASNYAATYVASTFVGAALSSTFAYMAVQATTAFVVGSTLSSALGGGNQQQQPAAQAAQARMQMVRSPAAVRQIVYGEVMTSGALVFAASSTDNNTLHLVIALAGHEVNSIGTFYLNDEAVGALNGSGAPTGGKYASSVVFKTHLGTTTQTADADLIAAGVGWTSAHRLRGIAYVYVKLTYDQSIFPTGIPNVRCVIQGKKLYDPRTTLTAYSNNSALVAYDYITTQFGAATAEMSAANWIAQANICDEAVSLAVGGTEARYTCNGVTTTDKTHRANLHQILSSCGGVVTTPQGIYHINVAAYTAPALALDEDILRAPMRVRAAVSKKNLYNAVKGQFINPSNYWQGSDFPPVVNITYAMQDGGQIFTDLQLPFTTSSPTAQRLARIALEKSRQGITVDLPCKISAIKVVPFENITLTISHLGWSAKVFKVMAVKINDNASVDLTLQEEASACYDWSASETTHDLAPNTNLPDPFSSAQPGNVQVAETLYETTGSAGIKSKAIMTWTAPLDAFVMDYEVEYKPHAGATWIEVFSIRGTEYVFYDMALDVYDFRVKARNILGVVSQYTPTTTTTLYGLTAAPGNVANFTVKAMVGLAIITWDRTVDLDVKIGGDVVIRWSPLTTGATWAASVVLPDGVMNGDATTSVVPLATGTYMAKFVDSTGHYSDTAASFVATEALTTGWSTVATSTQHTAFAGTKTNVTKEGNTIKLDGSLLIDDWGAIDGLGYIDSVGGVSVSGTYEFDATVNLGSVASRRFHAHIKATSYDAENLIDSRTALIDTWADIDGAAIDDCTATVYASVSDDDVTYSGWVPFMVSDFSCRYSKFRTLLQSGSTTHNIAISELSVAIKEPI